MAGAKRFGTKEKAHLEVYGHIGTLIAHLRDISRTGARLQLAVGNYVPQKGDLLNMTVRLDSLQREHNVAAEVIWTAEKTLGICFIHKNNVLERMMAKSTGF